MKVHAVLLAALLLNPAVLWAADAVTLRQAVELALSHNYLLQAANLERDAAQEAVSTAFSRYLPDVYLESGASLSDTPSRVFMMKLDEGRIGSGDFVPQNLNHPSPRGDFQTAVTLQQPLLDFGIANATKMAQKESEAAGLTLEQRKEDLAFHVYRAFLEVRRAKAYLDIAGQAVANAQEHRRLARVRAENGTGLLSDELRGATALAEAEQRQISARNQLLLARMRLNLAVGGAQGEALEIRDDAGTSAPPVAEGELVPLALRSRPLLLAAEKGVELGELAVRQARESFLPTIYAGASYQINDRDVPLGWDNDSWNVGVNLRWEIFDGSRRRHEKAKAELLKNAAQARLENEKQEVALQTTEAVLLRQEAAMRLESARHAVRDAEEGMRLVQKRFENGLCTMAELMDGQSSLNLARANLVEVENGYATATAQMYHAAGILLKEVMR